MKISLSLIGNKNHLYIINYMPKDRANLVPTTASSRLFSI